VTDFIEENSSILATRPSPLVAILMGTMNGARFLPEQLDSLAAQTHQNWVLIASDDGSTDDTRLILDSLTERRFKIIHLPENRGRGYARQIALENAEGCYLTYLDADDFFHPKKIELQVTILDKYQDVFLVSCGQGTYDNEYNLRNVRGLKYAGTKIFKFGNDIQFVSVTSMIRLPEARNFHYNENLNASEDIDYFSHYLNNRKYYNIDRVLYYYAEYESVKYIKIVEYSLNFIKSIWYIRYELKFFQVTLKLLKALFEVFCLILLFPFVSKEYYLKRRGLKCEESQSIEFQKVFIAISQDFL
jgi:glycosyltransferase involved in cell wall biosynthesis